MQTVIGSTGPTVMMMSLFGKTLYQTKEISQEIAPYSFSSYKLQKAFHLDNGLPMGASIWSALTKLASSDSPGAIGDLSWIEEGAQNQLSRADRLKKERQEKLESLPKDLNKLKQEIEQHIKKIQNDLRGCFGFYRHDARHEKIAALRSLFSHFKEDDHFDLEGFDKCMQQCHTSGVEAALGRSATKALVTRCENYIEQAIKLNLFEDSQLSLSENSQYSPV